MPYEYNFETKDYCEKSAIDILFEDEQKRQKKRGIYFGKEAENAINLYNAATTQQERNEQAKIVVPAFKRLIFGVMEMPNFRVMPVNLDRQELVENTFFRLLDKIDRFKPNMISQKTGEPVKAFSFFGTIAKNFILEKKVRHEKILQNKSDVETSIDISILSDATLERMSNYDRQEVEFEEDYKSKLDETKAFIIGAVVKIMAGIEVKPLRKCYRQGDKICGVCPVCNSKFEVPFKAKTQIYCSRKCRDENYKSAYADRKGSAQEVSRTMRDASILRLGAIVKDWVLHWDGLDCGEDSRIAFTEHLKAVAMEAGMTSHEFSHHFSRFKIFRKTYTFQKKTDAASIYTNKVPVEEEEVEDINYIPIIPEKFVINSMEEFDSVCDKQENKKYKQDIHWNWKEEKKKVKLSKPIRVVDKGQRYIDLCNHFLEISNYTGQCEQRLQFWESYRVQYPDGYGYNQYSLYFKKYAWDGTRLKIIINGENFTKRRIKKVEGDSKSVSRI